MLLKSWYLIVQNKQWRNPLPRESETSYAFAMIINKKTIFYLQELKNSGVPAAAALRVIKDQVGVRQHWNQNKLIVEMQIIPWCRYSNVEKTTKIIFIMILRFISIHHYAVSSGGMDEWKKTWTIWWSAGTWYNILHHTYWIWISLEH